MRPGDNQPRGRSPIPITIILDWPPIFNRIRRCVAVRLPNGYTFKDWTQKTSSSNSNNDSSSTISTSSKTTEGTPCTLKAGTPIMKSIELVKKIPTDEKK